MSFRNSITTFITRNMDFTSVKSSDRDSAKKGDNCFLLLENCEGWYVNYIQGGSNMTGTICV
jgi:hypothetical protein